MADRRNWIWIVWGAAIAFAGSSFAQTETEPDAKQFAHQFAPLVKQFCVDCHSGAKPKGNLRLDDLAADFTNAAARGRWSEVLEKLRSGEMPPKDKPRPTTEQTRSLIDWLAPRLSAAEAAARATQGRVVLRRLNRIEYENTIRDLLGIEIDLKDQLPPDSSADGFDNAGAAHHTSSFLLEKYLDAADAALAVAIANRPQPPPKIAKRYKMKDMHPIRSTTEDVYRFLDDGEVVCFCSSEWHNVWVSEFWPNQAGRFRFRISASGFQSKDKPVTFRVAENGSPLTGTSGLISYFDAPPDKPTLFEFTRFMRQHKTIAMLPYGFAGANTVKQTGGAKWEGPGLAIQYVEIEGPLYDAWPPESHRRIFGELPQAKFPAYNFSDRVEVVSKEPTADAERILTAFTRRAFRRNVAAEDVAPFLKLFEMKLRTVTHLKRRCGRRSRPCWSRRSFSSSASRRGGSMILRWRRDCHIFCGARCRTKCCFRRRTISNYRNRMNCGGNSNACLPIRGRRPSRSISSANGWECARSTPPSPVIFSIPSSITS